MDLEQSVKRVLYNWNVDQCITCIFRSVDLFLVENAEANDKHQVLIFLSKLAVCKTML